MPDRGTATAQQGGWIVAWTRGLTGETGYAPGPETEPGEYIGVVAERSEATPVNLAMAEEIAELIRSNVATAAWVMRA